MKCDKCGYDWGDSGDSAHACNFYQTLKPIEKSEQEPLSRAEYVPCCTDRSCPKFQAALTSLQRKPLTDEELFKLWDEDVSCDMPDTFTQFKHTARAIEAAHGIKGEA